jgi:glycosyltransferase involved in cell wall biosynthesis
MTNRLLIITQKVSKKDSYFGFFHDWITEFAKHTDITVISLEVHDYSFPENVRVLSMGKEKGVSKIKYLFNFYRYILTEKYDLVFAHMSPWYMILGYPFWLGKKKALWYVHRNVDLKLRLAHICADIVFTATPESFRIPSNKVQYMGQAIDITKFDIPKVVTEYPTITTVGRITPIKNLDVLIDAVKDIDVRVNIIGETVQPGDVVYKNKLVQQIKENNLESKITFVGAVPNQELSKWLSKSTISINLCPTGGLDKAVLESMAAHVPVLVSNRAFLPYIEKYKDTLLFSGVDECAAKIKHILSIDTREIQKYLFDQVTEKSSLPTLITRIYEALIQ